MLCLFDCLKVTFLQRDVLYEQTLLSKLNMLVKDCLRKSKSEIREKEHHRLFIHDMATTVIKQHSSSTSIYFVLTIIESIDQYMMDIYVTIQSYRTNIIQFTSIAVSMVLAAIRAYDTGQSNPYGFHLQNKFRTDFVLESYPCDVECQDHLKLARYHFLGNSCP
jgi:hypothetical protein